MKRHLVQWLVFIVSVAAFLVAVVFIKNGIEANMNRPKPMKTQEESHPDVSVLSVTPAGYAARVTAWGAVSPHYELSVSSQVEGRVVTLADGFETGAVVKKGTVLVQLEEVAYRSAVDEAASALSEARVSLLEEEREALQARTEWKASGVSGKPASELVLRGPQLAAAKAAVTAAETALAQAREDLDHTRITVPFDAVVVTREVAPGAYLQAGSAVATLYSVDRAEVTLSLSAEEWSRLPESDQMNSGNWPVTLTRIKDSGSWTGRILRAERHLDASSRQRNLIIAVDHPLDADPPLLAGTFVKADITGRQLENLWRLPGSALSQKGEVWYVTADKSLAAVSTEPVFTDGDFVYVSPPAELSSATCQVLVHPLNSYLQGMVVNPVEEANHE